MIDPYQAAFLPDVLGPSVCDGHFEDECIGLLCKQERTLSELNEARKRRRNSAWLDLTRQMCTQLLDFAEMHFSTERAEKVKRRLSQLDHRTRTLEDMIDAQSFKAIKRLVRMTVPDKENVRVAQEELCNEYAALCRDFFNDCVNRFAEDSAIREQFMQSVDTFLRELKRKW